MLRDRPYVGYLICSRVRKMGAYKFRNKQFTEEQFDQFYAKCAAPYVVAALCDLLDEVENLDWKTFDTWLTKNWRQVRDTVDFFDDVDLATPLAYHDSAPKDRGRKARRAMPPSYKADPAFIADKELFEAELEGRVEENDSSESN